MKSRYQSKRVTYPKSTPKKPKRDGGDMNKLKLDKVLCKNKAW
jgi:hypothetical protein